MLNYAVFKTVCLYLYFVFLLLMVFSDDVKSITSVQLIGELHNGVKIKNETDLVIKLNKLIKDGFDTLEIVSDFDNTLTADSGVPGKYVLNSFEMLRKCPSIPQSYREEEYKLYLKYKPVETNTNQTIEEKSNHLIQWYKEAEQMMKGIKLPINELRDIGVNVSTGLRDGVLELASMSEKYKIPFVILSSGLGDALTVTLDAANISSPYLKVVANFLELDNEGVIIGYKGKIIHAFNKNQAALKNTEFYNLIENRTNVLLIGDTLGDASMADGLENVENVIKIGYLSKKRFDKLPLYLDKFDIVLEDDQTMSVVIGILKLLQS